MASLFQNRYTNQYFRDNIEFVKHAEKSSSGAMFSISSNLKYLNGNIFPPYRHKAHADRLCAGAEWFGQHQNDAKTKHECRATIE